MKRLYEIQNPLILKAYLCVMEEQNIKALNELGVLDDYISNLKEIIELFSKSIKSITHDNLALNVSFVKIMAQDIKQLEEKLIKIEEMENKDE